jgi:hypothetical protein
MEKTFILLYKYKQMLATEKLIISSPRPAFPHSQAMNKQAVRQSPPATALKILIFWQQGYDYAIWAVSCRHKKI